MTSSPIAAVTAPWMFESEPSRSTALTVSRVLRETASSRNRTRNFGKFGTCAVVADHWTGSHGA